MRTVYEAAVNRIRFLFREFPRIVVSVSGGKDSTCLFYLVAVEAERQGRKFEAFFLDQEAEYQSTIEVIEQMMTHPLVIPRWYQVPIYMTNATSHRELFLYAWGEGEEWMREKHPLAIHRIEGEYPKRFYDFFTWFETQDTEPTAHLVGLRIFESLNRQRTMLSENGYKHYKWSTRCGPESYRFYPIYDWHFRDVWKYIADNNLPYNKIYDRMFARAGVNMRTMRISNLIHENSFRSLALLQEFEPETYDRLVRRLGGVHAAALYSQDDYVYSVDKLPPAFSSWREYRDYLLDTTPTEVRERYIRRFAGQEDDENVHRHQVRQILLNDWEGNLQNTRPRRRKIREQWWDLL